MTGGTIPVPNAVRERELRFPGAAGELAGSLLLPGSEGPYPAALIVAGSGPVDRDSNYGRKRLDVTRQVAVALAESGIASLRFDKRGVGGSRAPGEGRDAWKSPGFFDNAEDVVAAVHALRAQPDVTGPVLLVGHSEGAILVTRAAAQLLEGGEAEAGGVVRGVVLLSGSASTGEELLRWQSSKLPQSLPAPIRAILRLLRVDLAAKTRKTHAQLKATTTDTARVGGVRLNAKWYREFLTYDPREDLRRLQVPVLAITGSKDLQARPEDLAVIAAEVPGTPEHPVETWLAPDLSHLLRRQPKPASLRLYKQEIKQAVDAGLLQRVTAWCRSLL